MVGALFGCFGFACFGCFGLLIAVRFSGVISGRFDFWFMLCLPVLILIRCCHGLCYEYVVSKSLGLIHLCLNVWRLGVVARFV